MPQTGEKLIKKRRRQGKARSDRNRVLLRRLKSGPCMDCERTFPPYVMDFDHRDPTRKVARVAQLASKSTGSMLAEIEKCDLVCANCHRIRTYGGI